MTDPQNLSGRPPEQPSSDPSAPIYGDVPRYGYQQSGASEQDYPIAPPQQSYQPPYQQLAHGQPPYPQQAYPPPGQQPYADQAHGGQPYADQAYGGQPYAAPGYGGQPYAGQVYPGASYPVPVYPYAPWHRRVGAYLIDFLPSLIAAIPFNIGYFIWLNSMVQQPTLPPGVVPDFTAGLGWMAVGGVLLLAALAWQIYNRSIVAGRTGQSLGKRVLKIKLVAEATGQPIGALNAFLRDLLHILDGIAYVGYLWPLWDDKRQTFADKLMKTVVPDVPAATPAPTTEG